MASTDLQDAYLNIPIAARSQKYLRLALNVGKKVLHLPALPFGLSFGPQGCPMKVMAKALAPFASRRNRIPYLDFLLQQNLTRARAYLESIDGS